MTAKRSFRSRSGTLAQSLAILYLLCLLSGLVAIFEFREWIEVEAVDTYENIIFAVNPTAARSATYGGWHFDATGNPNLYDLNRAEYFYGRAAILDSAYPYVYHQLARIAFLRSDYSKAMYFINKQIDLHGDTEPNSYYVRGLIEGYMGDYVDSAKDYAYFLKFDPRDWAAKNDEAWVLLKAKRYTDALTMINSGLTDDPYNPWLLNSKATALYELKDYKAALAAAQAAQSAVQNLTDAQWSHAYPGNDPKIAGEGVATFQSAVQENIHTITLALASSTVQ